jgi:hypothetical protein
MSGNVPPSKRARIAEAIDLYQRFRGDDPEFVETVDVQHPDVLLIVGHCDGVLYTTERDGVMEKYIHEFKKRARPLLCSSHDGQALYLLGGDFTFTHRGIVDN